MGNKATALSACIADGLYQALDAAAPGSEWELIKLHALKSLAHDLGVAAPGGAGGMSSSPPSAAAAGSTSPGGGGSSGGTAPVTSVMAQRFVDYMRSNYSVQLTSVITAANTALTAPVAAAGVGTGNGTAAAAAAARDSKPEHAVAWAKLSAAQQRDVLITATVSALNLLWQTTQSALSAAAAASADRPSLYAMNAGELRMLITEQIVSLPAPALRFIARQCHNFDLSATGALPSTVLSPALAAAPASTSASASAASAAAVPPSSPQLTVSVPATTPATGPVSGSASTPLSPISGGASGGHTPRTPLALPPAVKSFGTAPAATGSAAAARSPTPPAAAASDIPPPPPPPPEPVPAAPATTTTTARAAPSTPLSKPAGTTAASSNANRSATLPPGASLMASPKPAGGGSSTPRQSDTAPSTPKSVSGSSSASSSKAAADKAAAQKELAAGLAAVQAFIGQSMELSRQIFADRDLSADDERRTVKPLSSQLPPHHPHHLSGLPDVYVHNGLVFVDQLSDADTAVRALTFRDCARKSGFSVALPLLCAVSNHNLPPVTDPATGTSHPPRLLVFSSSALPTADSLYESSSNALSGSSSGSNAARGGTSTGRSALTSSTGSSNGDAKLGTGSGNGGTNGAFKLSGLQDLFWKAKFGHTLGDSQRDTFMLQSFPTDYDVLRYLLQDLLHDALLAWERDHNGGGSGDAKLGTGSHGSNGGASGRATPPLSASASSSNLMKGEVSNAQLRAAAQSTQSLASLFAARSASAFVTAGAGPSGSGGVEIDNSRLYTMLQSPAFVRELTRTFNSEDRKAHGLAVRVLWLVVLARCPDVDVAAAQFASYTALYCSGAQFHVHVKNALFAILLGSPLQVVQNLDVTPKVNFYMLVKNPQTWQGFLSCLLSSDMDIRKSALEDVNTLLYGNFHNAQSLSARTGWQSWLFGILTDLPRAEYSHREPLKSIYAFTLNAFALIHQSYITRDKQFPAMLKHTLRELHAFAGHTSASAHVAHVLLQSLCSVLSKQHAAQEFPPNDDTHVSWQNLWGLLSLARWFVFQTRYWATAPTGVHADGTPVDSTVDDDEDGVGAPVLSRPASNLVPRAATTTTTTSLTSGPSSSLSGVASIGTLSRTGTASRSSAKLMAQALAAGGADGVPPPPPPLDDSSDAPSAPATKASSVLLSRSSSSRHMAGLTGSTASASAVGAGAANPHNASRSAASQTAAAALQSSQFVLSRARTTGARFEPVELGVGHHGLHWNSRGEPDDLALVSAVLSLLRALRLDGVRSDVTGGYSADFVGHAVRECSFWDDAKQLLAVCHRRYLDVARVYTYRRLSFVVQDFVKAKTSKERQALIADTKRDFSAAPAVPAAASAAGGGVPPPPPSPAK